MLMQRQFNKQNDELDDDGNATDVGNDQSMFILTILEKSTKHN